MLHSRVGVWMGVFKSGIKGIGKVVVESAVSITLSTPKCLLVIFWLQYVSEKHPYSFYYLLLCISRESISYYRMNS